MEKRGKPLAPRAFSNSRDSNPRPRHQLTRVHSGGARTGAGDVGAVVAPLDVRLAIPTAMPRTRTLRPISDRDRHGKAWNREAPRRSAAIDGPNLCLVSGSTARAMSASRGGRRRRLAFAAAEPVEGEAVQSPPVSAPAQPNDTRNTGVGPAPPETVALWVKVIATMGPTSCNRSRIARSASGTARR